VRQPKMLYIVGYRTSLVALVTHSLITRDQTGSSFTVEIAVANCRSENARPDIARLDNAAPYCKGAHRETCFSVRVDAQYKFMFDSVSI